MLQMILKFTMLIFLSRLAVYPDPQAQQSSSEDEVIDFLGE